MKEKFSKPKGSLETINRVRITSQVNQAAFVLKVLFQPPVFEIVQSFGQAQGGPVILKVWLNIADAVFPEQISRKDLADEPQPEGLVGQQAVGKLYFHGFGMSQVVREEKRNGAAGMESVFAVCHRKNRSGAGQPQVGHQCHTQERRDHGAPDPDDNQFLVTGQETDELI